MDFSFIEEQEDLQGLATQILEGELTHERLKEVEGGDENFDRELWAKLAEAGVLGIALPEAQAAVATGSSRPRIVLEQVGRTVAPVPYFATVVLGALPIAQFGTDASSEGAAPRRRVAATTVLTAALVEPGSRPARARPRPPHATATAGCSTAMKDCVPAGHARRPGRSVPASTADGKVVRRHRRSGGGAASPASARTRRTTTPRRGSR